MNKKNIVQTGIVILLLVYVICWIRIQLKSEQQLIAFCQQLHPSMPQQQVMLHAQQLSLRQFQSATDELMLVANKTLPETPSCDITFKDQKIISADLVIPRQSQTISVIRQIN